MESKQDNKAGRAGRNSHLYSDVYTISTCIGATESVTSACLFRREELSTNYMSTDVTSFEVITHKTLSASSLLDTCACHVHYIRICGPGIRYLGCVYNSQPTVASLQYPAPLAAGYIIHDQQELKMPQYKLRVIFAGYKTLECQLYLGNSH